MNTANFKSISYLIGINILIAILIACRYFLYLPESPEGGLAQVFLVSSLISHIALLVFIIGLPCYLLLFLSKRFNKLLISLYLSLFLAILLIDTQVFAQYKFHLNPAILNLIMGGQIVEFPILVWILAALSILALVLIQLFILTKIIAKQAFINSIFTRLPVTLILASLFSLLLTSHSLHIWASANIYQPITSLKPYLPVFYPATAISFMRKHGWINEELIAQQKALAVQNKSIINYPKEEIITAKIENPPNIMLIVFDSWRFDTFNANNTPNIWQLAQKGKIFNKHYSTGNSTTTGIFGLFYGLHGTYWHNFLNNQQAPLLMTRLQELNYHLGIFASAQLYRPEFNSTVFAKVPNLRLESKGNTPAERDKVAVEDWLKWHKSLDNTQPKFSFIFLDSAHGYDLPTDGIKKYQPETPINYLKLTNSTNPIPIFNRYKNSIFYMDSLISQVIERLEVTEEINNTLIIITGDHGEELNDTKKNYWGHNSNFTDYQIRVPLIIYNAKNEPIENLSSEITTHHIDIAPTLLKSYLGVANTQESFANGFNLAEPDFYNREWHLSSSYNKFAIITDELIFEVNSQGLSQTLDKNNVPIKNIKLEPSIIKQALTEITSFN